MLTLTFTPRHDEPRVWGQYHSHDKAHEAFLSELSHLAGIAHTDIDQYRCVGKLAETTTHACHVVGVGTISLVIGGES